MYGYQRPGPTQRTNIACNARIAETLREGREVQVFAMPDPGTLRHGSFEVNLAAGLEDSVIRELRPKWNALGK
jgi:hypothetical protein